MRGEYLDLRAGAPGCRVQQPLELLGGDRRREVIALRNRAAQLAQRRDAGCVLHAFGRDRQPEVASEVDDRAGNGPVARVLRQLADERSIELELPTGDS